ncbi:hypothetical protein EV175_001032 [Coemansia sp. RSA 1933]|nr:hypothetical protein EV175_001032 [Coemansia sp. RSA 1933]
MNQYNRPSCSRGAALDRTLPFDLLCRIFVLAQWPTLATVSRILYDVSRSRAVRARYCLAEFGRRRVLDGRVGLAGRRPRMFGQDLVLLLLNMGADPCTDDQWILRHACAQGWEPTVRKLLLMPAAVVVGTDGVATGESDMAALDNWRGSATAVDTLGTGGAGVRLLVDISDDDDAALRIAAGLGQTGVVRLLLGAGAGVHALQDEPLVLAAGNCHAETVRELLLRGANAQADNSRALRSAVMAGDANLAAVQMLVDAGAHVRAMDNSCILAACYKGDGDYPRPPPLPPQEEAASSDPVRLTSAELLKLSYAGASSTAGAPMPQTLSRHRGAYRMPQRYRNTPPRNEGLVNMDELAAAAPSAQRPAVTHVGVVRLLLARGADANARGGRPLAYACARGSVRTAALLLSYGADADALGGEALRSAAEHGHAAVIRLLLRVGADVHAGDEAALRNAARGGHSDIVNELLASGACAGGIGGVEALRAAARSGWAAVVQRLVEAGADARDPEFCAIALRSRDLRQVL